MLATGCYSNLTRRRCQVEYQVPTGAHWQDTSPGNPPKLCLPNQTRCAPISPDPPDKPLTTSMHMGRYAVASPWAGDPGLVAEPWLRQSLFGEYPCWVHPLLQGARSWVSFAESNIKAEREDSMRMGMGIKEALLRSWFRLTDKKRTLCN